MQSAYYPLSSYPDRESLRRRTAAFSLALGANVLLVMALLTLAPSPSGAPGADRKPVAFRLLPDAGATSSETAAKAKRASGGASRPKSAIVVPPPPPVVPPMPAPPIQLNILHIGREELAATDRVLRTARREDAADGASGGEGQSGAADAGGAGPGGERLYNAEWYVRPTQAELAFYMPAGGPRTGWGMIACRTVANYRVDDCVEIGQSPPGSGLASAVRQAAWQFRIMPPRIGPRRVIGAWVRIRIDYTEAGAK